MCAQRSRQDRMRGQITCRSWYSSASPAQYQGHQRPRRSHPRPPPYADESVWSGTALDLICRWSSLASSEELPRGSSRLLPEVCAQVDSAMVRRGPRQVVYPGGLCSGSQWRIHWPEGRVRSSVPSGPGQSAPQAERPGSVKRTSEDLLVVLPGIPSHLQPFYAGSSPR
jgi:hypothetical protein